MDEAFYIGGSKSYSFYHGPVYWQLNKQKYEPLASPMPKADDVGTIYADETIDNEPLVFATEVRNREVLVNGFSTADSVWGALVRRALPIEPALRRRIQETLLKDLTIVTR